jgi:hypothetical protein
MRNYDGYLVETGEQWVQLALQNYTVPRVHRITNREGMEKYLRMHIEQSTNPETGEVEISESGDPIRVAVVTNFKEDDLGRQVPDEANTMKYVIRGTFDVKVNTGTGLPFKKAEKERRLLELFDRGIIDKRAYFEETDYPNFEPILQRVEEAEQAAAQAQGV